MPSDGQNWYIQARNRLLSQILVPTCLICLALICTLLYCGYKQCRGGADAVRWRREALHRFASATIVIVSYYYPLMTGVRRRFRTLFCPNQA